MLTTIITTLICVLIPTGIAFMISDDSILINDIPMIYWCIFISFLIHWIIFIPSAIKKNEKFYDFTGMIAYLSVVGFALYQKNKILGSLDIDSIIIGTLITIWTLRLGIFLFYRVFKVGEDQRFREVKTSPSKFFVWFSVSGLWVSLTSIAGLNILSSKIDHNDYFFVYFGLLLWVFGFLFEVIADYQKMKFKNDKVNDGKFISSGLWSISRHPNYFGEIILWIGIFIISLPSLEGFEYLTVISPLFVYILLNKISGINLLEKKADETWGDLEEYKNYKKSTPELIPKFWN